MNDVCGFLRLIGRHLITIRPAQHADIPAIIAIEQESFKLPWSKKDFELYRDGPRHRICGGRYLKVIQDHSYDTVGYCAYSLSTKLVHIQSMAVAESARRMGLGRRLIVDLAKLLQLDYSGVIGLVSEWNDRGHKFFVGCGFKATGVISEHYCNGDSAYVFRLNNQESAMRDTVPI